MSASRATVPPASRDQAERYLFTALPQLDARERRALALAELAGVDRGAIAAELAMGTDDVAATLAAARKALRRSHLALAAGGRCERTERLVSDALDGPVGDAQQRRRDAHLARCPRCREHVEALTVARAALRDGFAASHEVHPAPIVPRPPVAPATPPKLRVVPEPPPLAAPQEPVAEPEPQPVAEPEPVTTSPPEPQPAAAPALPTSGPGDLDPGDAGPLVAPAPTRASAPVPEPVAGPPQREAAEPPPPTRHARHRDPVRRAITAVLVVFALLVAALAGAAVLGTDAGGGARAPWDAPGAPNVDPAPLSSQ